MSVGQGDPESYDVTDEDRDFELVAESVTGAAVGTLVGAWVDPVTGTLVGSAVAPTLHAFRRLNRNQFVRAARVLNGAAAICEVDPQKLPELADSTSKEFLLATALQAGADSALKAKIAALGKVLADGLRGDDVMVDTTTMLASAFGDIERPHVRVLDYLAPLGQPPIPDGPDAPGALALVQFLEANPGYRTSISAIVATLERHGIIRTEGEPLKQKDLVWGAYHVGSIQLRYRYRITPFGDELLGRLREAGEAAQ